MIQVDQHYRDTPILFRRIRAANTSNHIKASANQPYQYQPNNNGYYFYGFSHFLKSVKSNKIGEVIF
jgi:hypothetical protein